MSRQGPKGRNLIRKSNEIVKPSDDSDLTIFAVALALAFGSVVFAFSPLLLNLEPTSPASDFLLSVALALLLWAVFAVIAEFRKFSGIFQHEGWTDLFTTLLLALLPTTLFGILAVFELSAWIDLTVTGTALVLCLPVCLGVGATLDAFLIRPRLRPPPSKKEQRKGTYQTPNTLGILGATAAFITWSLSNVASFLTITEQLLSGK